MQTPRSPDRSEVVVGEPGAVDGDADDDDERVDSEIERDVDVFWRMLQVLVSPPAEPPRRRCCEGFGDEDRGNIEEEAFPTELRENGSATDAMHEGERKGWLNSPERVDKWRVGRPPDLPLALLLLEDESVRFDNGLLLSSVHVLGNSSVLEDMRERLDSARAKTGSSASSTESSPPSSRQRGPSRT